MNREEALKKIEELERFIANEEVVMVPDCIEIEYVSKGGHCCQCLNNGDMSLFLSEGKKGLYIVYEVMKCSIRPHKLVQCKRSDLKPGDVAFRSDYSDYDEKTRLLKYCIILNDTEYIYWLNQNTTIDNDMTWKYWYKCVPVEGN